jgi:RTX calcium-binding nonapeptide repeat (4 copies)
MTRTRRKWAVLACVLGLATLVVGIGTPLGGLAPGTAAAATVELRGDRLEIRGDANPDWLAITRREGQFKIHALDYGVTLTTASADCDAAIDFGLAKVECPATGIELIDASTGAGNDFVSVSGGSFFISEFDDRLGCFRRIILGAKLEVRTGDGKDYAELSGRRDVVRGGAEQDHLYGCGGDDTIKGGAGTDLLSGDQDDDLLVGGRDRDWIVGCLWSPFGQGTLPEVGDDKLRGGRGPDILYGCRGVDSYRAGGGPDKLKTHDRARDRTSEKVHCGGGRDLFFSDPEDHLTLCEEQRTLLPFQPSSTRLFYD